MLKCRVGHGRPDGRTGRPANHREDHDMCLTCGCMDAHKKMGEHNIT
jgi:hypothetical protein